MRIVVAIIAGVVLAGCTDSDWSQSLTRLGVNVESSDASAPAFLAPHRASAALAGTQPMLVSLVTDGRELQHGGASGIESLCQSSARDDADSSGFDQATRERLYRARLTQCQDIAAHSVPWH
ncbi:MAG: hypothetical protein BGN85_01255 [Alphaproteobacteria bacterium 64-11]|nr:hypothetical protein [Alphaproteobacteria bacterium]OJU09529.1 MAG: hypothetical protein BGN85_01255 [Alphaproteobacteria bacterium 64-11]